MSTAPVFEGSDGRFVATDLGRGPWDPRSLHGGAPAALLMREFERLPAAEGLLLSRVTYEFMRPAPVGPLEVRAEVVRPGRRVQLLEGSIAASGVEVVRARALQLQPAAAGTDGPDDAPPPPGPEHGRPRELRAPHRPMFAPDAIEIRFVNGEWAQGPCTAWFRLNVPIVAGEEPSPLQRLAAAGDFGNGISATLSWDDYLFINPDLTLYVGARAGRRMDRPGLTNADRGRRGRARRKRAVRLARAGGTRDSGPARGAALSLRPAQTHAAQANGAGYSWCPPMP